MSIIKEGIYFDLPSKEYHAAEGVSKSLLFEFASAASPLHFRNRDPKVATADMEFGTVCHTAILQPELLSSSYYVRPDQYPSTPKPTKADPFPEPEMVKWSGNATWCKDWLKTHSDRPVLTREQEAKIPHIQKRVRELPEFGSALRNGKTEVSFFKMDEETGLMLKCRCDLMSEDETGKTWIFDPKKVQSGSAIADFRKQAFDLMYHVQCASYLAITGASRFVFVPFDDDKPFDACQFEPDRDMRTEGYREWRRLLLAYAKCLKANEWPGYPVGIQPLELPEWVKKRV
jgi:hypothetical protein